MMSSKYCTICGNQIKNIEYDLEKDTSQHSKTILFNLVKNVIEESVGTTEHSIICMICYILLNELDELQFKAKEIEERLKGYYNNRNVKNQINVEHEAFEDSNPIIELQIEHKNGDIIITNNVNQNCDKVEEEKIVETSDDELEIKEKTTNFNKNNNHKCNECSKIFKTSNELKSHLISHSEERPFICEICGQGYKRQQALTIHVAMHQGINPFTCTHCNKSFTQKTGLMRHIRIHTGQMPYQCDLCGKRFIHHTSFNQHKASHTGERLHKCNLCGLSLMTKSHLKRHTRVHTGEKKFACSVCGRKFTERYNLVAHEKIHSGIDVQKKFQCPICNNYYSRKKKLEEHLLCAHQKIVQDIESGS